MKFWLIVFLTYFSSTIVHGQIAVRQALAWYEKGERQFNTGEYDSALRSFNTCTQLNALYYDAYTSRAAVKERLHDLAGALVDYSIYLDKFPTNNDVLFSRGLVRYQVGQYKDAQADFIASMKGIGDGETQTIFYRQSAEGGTDKIMTSQGSQKDYLLNYIGLTEFKLLNTSKAILYFDSAIAINPYEPDYFVHRGQAKEAVHDLVGTEADYQQALQLNPDHALANHNLGILLKAKGLQSDAEAQYTKSIELNPERYFTYLERAYYRQESGNLRGALDDYNKAITLKPNDVESWVNRGLVKERLRNFNGAYDDFTHAIRMNESHDKAWFCRGNVLSKLNKLEAARDDYTVAIFYHPSYGSAYFNRAIIYHRLNQKDKACVDVAKAASLGITDGGKLSAKVCQ